MKEPKHIVFVGLSACALEQQAAVFAAAAKAIVPAFAVVAGRLEQIQQAVVAYKKPQALLEVYQCLATPTPPPGARA